MIAIVYIRWFSIFTFSNLLKNICFYRWLQSIYPGPNGQKHHLDSDNHTRVNQQRACANGGLAMEKRNKEGQEHVQTYYIQMQNCSRHTQAYLHLQANACTRTHAHNPFDLTHTHYQTYTRGILDNAEQSVAWRSWVPFEASHQRPPATTYART